MAFTRGCLFSKIQNGVVQRSQSAPTFIKVGSGASPADGWAVSAMRLLKEDQTPGPAVPLAVLKSTFPVHGTKESGDVNLDLTALDNLRSSNPVAYDAIRDTYLTNGMLEVVVPTSGGDQPILVHLRALVSTRYSYSRTSNTANPGCDPNFNMGTDPAAAYSAMFAPNAYRLPVTSWTSSILPTGAPASPVFAAPCLLRITRQFTTLSDNNASAPYDVVSDIGAQVAII
jgi:hypothetical protein